MSPKNKFFVTTPIYYANSKPHLGTLYSTLLADVANRWAKLMGKNSFFLTGLDEHGQKMAEAAKAKGVDNQAFADSMVPAFKDMWTKYNLEYNDFIRTSSQTHKEAVQKFYSQLIEQGDVYKSEYTGLYCTPCETFVTTEEAGDKNSPTCPSCGRAITEVSEESYFFKLSKYEDQLLKFYENNPDFLTPTSRLNEVVSFVKGGLKDLCISRKTVSWGVPFPGDEQHTIYVWCDALVNYISAIGFGENSEQFKNLWPADLHVLGKDIVRFHAVYWPALLMAAKLELPKKLLVHGFIMVKDQKMSKSLGNAVDPGELLEKYGQDQVRHYLLRHIAVTQDGTFDFEELEKSINADLANNLGNLLSRTQALASKNNLSSTDGISISNEECLEVQKQVTSGIHSFKEEMEKNQYHIALANLWSAVSDLNAFFHTQAPWKLAKSDTQKFKEVIAATAESLLNIAIVLWPIMPTKMAELCKNLGHSFDLKNDYSKILEGKDLEKKINLIPSENVLFSKIEKGKNMSVEIKETKKSQTPENKNDAKFATIDDLLKIKIAVGQIQSCEKIEKSEKLYKLMVDFGEFGERQVLSGIAKYFTPEQLLGTKAAFVINLKPRKIMGLESQAMILAANDQDNFGITTFSNKDLKPGSLLS